MRELLMKTNGGSKIIKEIADDRVMDMEVHFHADAITNLYALKDVVKKGRVYYDSAKEDAFFVEVKKPGVTNKLLKFNATKDGLYVLKDPQGQSHANFEGFSRRQIDAAKKARRLYHQL